jgi:hypothetical protein
LLRKERLLRFALAFLVLAFVSEGMINTQVFCAVNDFPTENNTRFSSATQFVIPSLNGSVSFDSGGSYARASLDNKTWNFEGFFFNVGTSALPNTNGVRFSVSVENCNVTVTHIDVLNVVPPFPGELDYIVAGVGSQSFNLHYSNPNLVAWRVFIDGTEKSENDGWLVSADGTITVNGATSEVKICWDEASVNTFISEKNFAIPSLNGTVNFASNGSYLGTPNLVDNIFYFQNLVLNGLNSHGIPLWNLAVSAENCGMTITAYDPGVLTGATHVATWLNYTLDGLGNQTVNLDYGYTNGNIGWDGPTKYAVYIDGENRSQGNGWMLLDNGWLTITGATSNVSIYSPPNTAADNFPPPIPPSPITSTPTPKYYADVSSSPQNSQAPNFLTSTSNLIIFILAFVALVVTASLATYVLRNRKLKT